ncbi:MAG TPA: MBL fold metallo-hydrolase [Acidimicrobiales bacterium]|nr:MBL fold metallo-hydrolase [Acidimicrobiales bacterium]
MRQEQEDARPEVTEVAPGILRAQIPIHFTGLGHVNTYLFEDERGWAAMDPGLPGPATWKALKDRLRQVGAKVKDVHTVVVTHSHPDHFGSAEKLRREAGAELVTATAFRTFFDLLEPDLVESPTARSASSDAEALERLRNRFDQKTPWGGDMPRPPLPGAGPAGWIKRRVARRYFMAPRPNHRVDDGQTLKLGRREFVGVHTPGHTADHLCLFDPTDGVLLSGDHVLPSITPHISGLGSVSDDPLDDFIGSLDKVAALDGVSLCLPAHGHPFTNIHERVDAIKRHHEERLAELAKISHDLGEADVETLMRELFSERAWGNMAEAETYAHLEHLRLAGRAESRRGDDGLLRYVVA